MNKKLSTSLVASFLLATNLLSNELDQITVTSATKSEQSIKDVTSNVEVITKEDIEERHFTTVTEALNTLAGINVTSNGGLGKSTSIFLRGFDNQRVLVLIDGINYNDYTGISGARLEHLLIDDVAQIEIIKGAQSGVWGADANAGVINIITKSAKKGSSASVQVELGSYNTKKFNASISKKTDTYDVKFNATRLLSDGFSSRVPYGDNADDYEKDGYENTTLNLKAGLNVNDNNRVEISQTYINAKSEYDSSLTNQDGHELETKNSYTSLNFLNNNKFSDLKVYANYSKINRDDPSGWTTNFDGSVKEFGIHNTISYFEDSSFLKIGADYKVTTHENDVNKELKNKALFITNSTKFDKLIFTQSLRYDKYDLFDNKLTGKIGLKFNVNNDLYLSSNYGTAYNVPVFYKLYNAYAGNPDLQPETTKSADITLGYKFLTLTYFYNKITSMIEYDSINYNYYNMDGDVTLQGIELGIKKDLTNNLLASLNYTYTDAKDNNDKTLQRRAKNSVKFGFDYYGINKLHLNVNGEYVGDRVQYNFGTYDISAQTGNYTIWNSVINYEINRNFSTYLKVDNLFDKYYQTVDGYATAQRSAYIGLKATF